MPDSIITVENLGKKYSLRHAASRARYTALRDVLAHRVQTLLRPTLPKTSHRPTEDFWALKEVSFEVKTGEVLGIIGRNGAGKSTLLKVLSRITEPTIGRITLKGRVASLLEVGTGFHPELTGRENVYLNGAILGMSRLEIRSKFDEIVAFAEVERFLDTPVKHYSSGMYVRLAFAVAAHLEPEILVVDEVLAVGDAEFQKKCLGKMDDVARSGRTVLFVSHNMGAVSHLCTSCIWLDKGMLKMEGGSREVVAAYFNSGGPGVAEATWEGDSAPGDEGCRLRRVRISQAAGIAVSQADITKALGIDIEVEVFRPIKDLGITLFILDQEGRVLLHTCDLFGVADRLRQPGLHHYKCMLPPYALNCGTYQLSIASDIPNEREVFSAENVLRWEMMSSSVEMIRYKSDSWAGVLGPGIAEWTVKPASASVQTPL